MPALAQIIAWCHLGDKHSSETIIVYWRIYAPLGLNELSTHTGNVNGIMAINILQNESRFRRHQLIMQSSFEFHTCLMLVINCDGDNINNIWTWIQLYMLVPQSSSNERIRLVTTQTYQQSSAHPTSVWKITRNPTSSHGADHHHFHIMSNSSTPFVDVDGVTDVKSSKPPKGILQRVLTFRLWYGQKLFAHSSSLR